MLLTVPSLWASRAAFDALALGKFEVANKTGEERFPVSVEVVEAIRSEAAVASSSVLGSKKPFKRETKIKERIQTILRLLTFNLLFHQSIFIPYLPSLSKETFPLSVEVVVLAGTNSGVTDAVVVIVRSVGGRVVRTERPVEAVEAVGLSVLLYGATVVESFVLSDDGEVVVVVVSRVSLEGAGVDGAFEAVVGLSVLAGTNSGVSAVLESRKSFRREG